jgi:hypothetical protein
MEPPSLLVINVNVLVRRADHSTAASDSTSANRHLHSSTLAHAHPVVYTSTPFSIASVDCHPPISTASVSQQRTPCSRPPVQKLHQPRHGMHRSARLFRSSTSFAVEHRGGATLLGVVSQDINVFFSTPYISYIFTIDISLILAL